MFDIFVNGGGTIQNNNNVGLKENVSILLSCIDCTEPIATLVGYINNSGGTVNNYFATGMANVSINIASGGDAGGLVGNNKGIITNGYTDVNVIISSNQQYCGAFMTIKDLLSIAMQMDNVTEGGRFAVGGFGGVVASGGT